MYLLFHLLDRNPKYLSNNEVTKEDAKNYIITLFGAEDIEYINEKEDKRKNDICYICIYVNFFYFRIDSSSVLSAKDLKPCSSNLFKYIVFSYNQLY